MNKLFVYITALGLPRLLSDTGYAYVDPGTSSMMLQIVLGGLAGLAVFLKICWRQLLVFFRISKDKESDSEQTISDE